MDFFISYIEFINTYIDKNFYLSIFLFLFFLIIYNSFCIPGNLFFCLCSGFFFDVYLGFIINIISIVTGSFIFFSFSNFFINTFFSTYFNKYSKTIISLIKKSSYEYLILLRLIPGPPLFAQNICLSILSISKIKFIFTTILGFAPIMFFSAFIGDKFSNFVDLKKFNFNEFYSFEFILILLLIILFVFMRIFFKNKT